MKKRIGIITHYYHTLNYGGVLQAYALCKYLNSNGYSAEQICFDYAKHLPGTESNNGTIEQYLKRKALTIYYKFLSIQKDRKNKKVLLERKKVFYPFEDEVIPHSSYVYKWDQIKECVDDYDCFITGSDLVWSAPDSYYWDPFLLGFATGKRKISYGASLGKTCLTNSETEAFRVKLKDYQGISVREKKSAVLLQNICPIKPTIVVDPVLLLSSQEWKSMCGHSTWSKPYAFCFFLGGGLQKRNVVSEYAKQEGLHVITVPHLDGLQKNDLDFGDERLISPTPMEFINLIANAEIVFTDSFHATAFASIFHIEYFVFLRNESEAGINERLKNITRLFGAESHYCSKSQQYSIEYIRSVERINYNNTFEADLLIQESKEYLERNLQ